MSIDPFPERVAARKLCHGNGTINSIIPLAKLLRLSEYLDDHKGQAEVVLSYSRDESGNCLLSGQAHADVRMQCQRCLESVDVQLGSSFRLIIAEDDEDAAGLSRKLADPQDSLDMVVCEEGKLDLLTLVEDELIMSLPIVAAHEDPACSDKLNSLRAEADKSGMQQGNIKGLESLEALKKELSKGKSDGKRPDSEG